tara:strand:- start:17 stop:589 length:573 start_codon:yes stop_codon:yes gene_type:complete
MPWKLGDKIIREGRSWSNDSVTHPTNWAIWSDADKKAAGLTWEDPPASEEPYDSRFYWGRKTDGTLIPKSLTDVKVVNEDGKAVIDPLTGQQRVTKGLKTIYIEQSKQTANHKLSATDWYVTRKAEDSTTTIPSDVTTYRAAVRTKSGTIEKAITDAADHTAFMALFDAPVDSDGNVTGNAPINDWPDEI